MELMPLEHPGHLCATVRLDDEPLESLVICVTQIVCDVLAESPLGRPVDHADRVHVRVAVRETVWGTLESMTEDISGGRVATFTAPGGERGDWTALLAWRVADALAPTMDEPGFFEYLAEELSPTIADHIGLDGPGKAGGSLARCHELSARHACGCQGA